MNRRQLLGAAPSLFLRPLAAAGKERFNVLFITIDDLRPQLGCFGDRQVRSPHIDKLASQGIVFERAYCQQALCGPSRTSFLTGLRPDTTKVHDIETHFRSTVPSAVTLPQLFKNNGYFTRGFYKVFHLAGFDPSLGNLNDPPSWSEPHWLPTQSVYGPEGKTQLDAAYSKKRAAGEKIGYSNLPRSVAMEAADVADDQMSDGEMTAAVLETIRAHAGRPFFLAAGFYKPHLPFAAPKRYFDLYRESELRLPSNQFAPKGAPAFALQNTAELRTYTDIPKSGPIDAELGKRLLHAYLACISYVDAQVGRLMEGLEKLKLRERTVVVLLGDNGYQIGEHNMWGSKHTNFETSARVPLIVSAPGFQRNRRSRALVELVDLYPTLADVCGLQAPSELEGVSFKPLGRQPNRAWKQAAFTQYPKGGRLGRSIRTDRYRYTEWNRPSEPADVFELYDHAKDPEENENIAATEPGELGRLREVLQGGWKAAMPQ
jgi:iduronate 2-sulfatase